MYQARSRSPSCTSQSSAKPGVWAPQKRPGAKQVDDTSSRKKTASIEDADSNFLQGKDHSLSYI